MSFKAIDVCRSCGSDDLYPVLDLGSQPMANALRRQDDDSPEVLYPLSLYCCLSCSLVQLTGTVEPEEMFDEYPYFSSFSTTMLEEMSNLAERTISGRSLGTDSLVVEIASNDGYLLQNYLKRGVPVLGIDPARNVADVAVGRGIPTLVEYFGRDLAVRIVHEHGRADVIHANNVLAHIPEINDVVAGIAELLDDDGMAIVETPYLVRMIERLEFDTVYHEHVFYYSVTALNALFGRHGLVIADIEEIDIHGGSLRLSIAHDEVSPQHSVERYLREESSLGVSTAGFYEGFDRRVEELKSATLSHLVELKNSGASLAAYGAAAKGTVLCNHFGIGPDLVSFVVDRSPHKQGYLVPGVHIPIRGVDALLKDRPDYTLLLAWNFASEVIEQQQEYVESGGRFIVPIPDYRVVTN